MPATCMCASPPSSRCRNDASSPLSRSPVATPQSLSCRVDSRQVQQSVECCGTLGICFCMSMDLTNPRTFSAVYDQHSAAVYGTALRVLGNQAQAQDVAQDVFLRLWRNPRRFDERRGELGPYLRLMARSRALDVWRDGQAAGRASDRLKPVVAG